jgi:hypothetical protein
LSWSVSSAVYTLSATFWAWADTGTATDAARTAAARSGAVLEFVIKLTPEVLNMLMDSDSP